MNTSVNRTTALDSALLQLLLAVATDLSQASLDEIMRSLVIRLQSFYDANHACIHLVDQDDLRDETVAGGLTSCPVHEARDSEKGSMARVEAALNNLAVARGEPVNVSTAQQEVPGWERLARVANIAGGIAIPLIHQNETFGVINLYFTQACPISDIDVAALQTLGKLAYGAIEKELRLRALREHDDVVTALAQAIEAKDSHTGGHVGRVMHLAMALGNAVGLGGRDLRMLRRAAILHDLGKIGVPEAVLNKPGKLTGKEFAHIRRHPDVGASILCHLDAVGLDDIVAGVRGHHERWDGTGYPQGLAGEQIPILARIVAVADTYDALTSDRPYRPAFSSQKALDIMIESRGRHLDPTLLDLFVEQHLYEQVRTDSHASSEK